MKKTIIIFLMALFIMVGCTSKQKEVTFSKTSQDIWGEIIINDTDKITIPTTLKQLGKDYSFNDVKVKGDGFVGTSLEKEGYRRIQVSVEEKEPDDINENSIINRIAIYSSIGTTASICGVKIGDSEEKMISVFGKPDEEKMPKGSSAKYIYYYGENDKKKQRLSFDITNKKVTLMEVRYLPEEYLNKE